MGCVERHHCAPATKRCSKEQSLIKEVGISGLASHTLLSMINDFPILCQTQPDGKRLGESFTRFDQNNGSIEKFKLAAYCYPDHSDLDEWIIFLTVKGIKELILQDFSFTWHFKFSSCLFFLVLTNLLRASWLHFQAPFHIQRF